MQVIRRCPSDNRLRRCVVVAKLDESKRFSSKLHGDRPVKINNAVIIRREGGRYAISRDLVAVTKPIVGGFIVSRDNVWQISGERRKEFRGGTRGESYFIYAHLTQLCSSHVADPVLEKTVF